MVEEIDVVGREVYRVRNRSTRLSDPLAYQIRYTLRGKGNTPNLLGYSYRRSEGST